MGTHSRAAGGNPRTGNNPRAEAAAEDGNPRAEAAAEEAAVAVARAPQRAEAAAEEAAVTVARAPQRVEVAAAVVRTLQRAVAEARNMGTPPTAEAVEPDAHPVAERAVEPRAPKRAEAVEPGVEVAVVAAPELARRTGSPVERGTGRGRRGLARGAAGMAARRTVARGNPLGQDVPQGAEAAPR